ncbi:transposase [Arthrobacter sp. Hiyo8]|nr:transposase [Arthrobacter sp. Hiyo8]
MPFIQGRPGEDGTVARELSVGRWGLIPTFHRGERHGHGRGPGHDHQRPDPGTGRARRPVLGDLPSAPAIQALAEDDGPLQMSLFDEQDLAEISHPDYPGERLIACRNPPSPPNGDASAPSCSPRPRTNWQPSPPLWPPAANAAPDRSG